VVVVGLAAVPDGFVVDVVGNVVAGDVVEVFLENSSPAPVSNSARITTERMTRSGHLRWGRTFEELRVSLSRNSGEFERHW